MAKTTRRFDGRKNCMEWYLVIGLFFILLMLFLFSGFPVAFAFLTVNIVLSIIFIGFESGILNLVNSSFDALAKFTLTPIPMFILMGETLFHAGLVLKVVDAFNKLLGVVPARLSILTLGTGTFLSAMSGSAVGDAALLGSTLAPEMRKNGYHIKMIVGPILAASSLALIIPPSTNAILYGSTARLSIGDLFIAGVIPGLIIAFLTVLYYMVIASINPTLAPKVDVSAVSLKERMMALVSILPIVGLILLVLGFIFWGIVTPTESAAVGALGAIILALAYRGLNREAIKNIILGTLRVTAMVLAILSFSAGFSQLLAFTGASRDLVSAIISWDVSPAVIILLMLFIVLILGTFVDPISIMMITIPLYMPVIDALNFDPIWFATMMLICIGLGNITPPFGLLLFVVKGVLPENTTERQIYGSVIAVVLIQIIVVFMIFYFPEIATWLPSKGNMS